MQLNELLMLKKYYELEFIFSQFFQMSEVAENWQSLHHLTRTTVNKMESV